MNLYRWNSEYLKEWASGYIIIMAESVSDAREVARRIQVEHVRERYAWLDPNDSDSADELEMYRRCFERDIETEPEILKAGGMFIQGSQ